MQVYTSQATGPESCARMRDPRRAPWQFPLPVNVRIMFLCLGAKLSGQGKSRQVLNVMARRYPENEALIPFFFILSAISHETRLV